MTSDPHDPRDRSVVDPQEPSAPPADETAVADDLAADHLTSDAEPGRPSGSRPAGSRPVGNRPEGTHVSGERHVDDFAVEPTETAPRHHVEDPVTGADPALRHVIDPPGAPPEAAPEPDPFSARGGVGIDSPAVPSATPFTGRRRSVASYDDYVAAQLAVDYLSDERFPVEAITIVGTGLRFEEHVTGRRDTLRSALESAGTGAILGALLGWFLGVFSLVDPIVSGLLLALWGAVIGALLGAAVGALAHTATGGRRDFSSLRGYRADAYEVHVDDAYADEAERLIERMPVRR